MLHFPGVEVDCGIALAATQLLTRHGMGLRFEVKSLTTWYLDVFGNVILAFSTKKVGV